MNKKISSKDKNVEIKQNKTKEKNIESKKDDSKDKNSKIKIIFITIIILLLIIIFITNSLIKNNNTKNIESVKKILKSKYVDVECIDSYCNGIVAVKGDKLSKYKVELYDSNGKKIASYIEKYNSKAKSTKTPYQMSKSYFIMKITNNNDEKKVKYSINNKNGKEKYSTDNILTVLNDKFVLMKNDDDKYTILDTKGKELYSNISDVNTYYNGEYISIKIENTYTILNGKGEKVLSNYKIEREVKVSDEEDNYLIIKNTKENTYYYYSIKKNKVIGDGFESYKTGENSGEIIVTKKVNDTKEKYILNKDGKQKKQDEIDLTEIKNQIDSKEYFLYTASIMKKHQKNVLVDNKSQKALGILNLESNKFTPLYSYKVDNSYFYSTISKLSDNEDDLYLKITCSEYSCETPKTIIFDAEHTKEIYRIEKENLIVSDYISYESGYSVVKYSSTTKDEKYKNKYVLYNKDNKELYISSNRIVLIDKKVKFGNEMTSSLTLYSIKDKKALNEENEASVVKISDKKLYKYEDRNNNIIICDENGKTIITTKSNNLKYSSENIIYLDNGRIYIYDVSKNKTEKYRLKNNEKINDSSGDIIAPYRGSVFINNSTDKYIKVLNKKARVIKKIKNAEISEVRSNPKSGNVYIITKSTNKTGNIYGLYIAK